jgi:hypothetical protein
MRALCVRQDPPAAPPRRRRRDAGASPTKLP